VGTGDWLHQDSWQALQGRTGDAGSDCALPRQSAKDSFYQSICDFQLAIAINHPYHSSCVD
jgi:hypothetical protein